MVKRGGFEAFEAFVFSSVGMFLCLFAIAIMGLSLIALPQVSALERIGEVRPEITAVFSEDVVLIPPFFVVDAVNPSHVIFLDLVFQQDDRTFVFVPQKSLSNAQYEFVLYASDLVGNVESYTYDFEVYVPGTRILLIEPNSIGVANSTTFQVGIFTSRPSACKYTGVPVSDFEDIRLRWFDVTGDESTGELVEDHFILAYTVEEAFPKRFFVVCRDDLGRENSEGFTLYADTVAPRIVHASFSPSPILEYPDYGDLRSLLRTTVSEPALCRYSSDDAVPFVDMVAFPGYDEDDYDAFVDSHEKDIFFPGETIKDEFDYYVQCRDRAGFLSEKKNVHIKIDLTEGLKARVISPPESSRKTAVFLNVTTNKRAYCFYKSNRAGTGDPTTFADPEAALSSSIDSLSTVHWKDLGVKAAGVYTISIRCMVPEGIGLNETRAELSYTYTIDTQPPTAPVVNATTPVCEHVLSAEFFATDAISGISGYAWTVGEAGFPFASGNTSDTGVSVSNYRNGSALFLEPGVGYFFNVVAVDGAGNVGPPGLSQRIEFDATGIVCDTTPPVVTVIRSEDGTSATITCEDDQSGCALMGSVYGTSTIDTCNATQYFINPVTVAIYRSTYICWKIKDEAGNFNQGSQFLELTADDLNITPGEACLDGIDNDGDGYGERCLLGADCDDTDPDKAIGCANGCIQDLDGDGFGIGCTAGADCNGQNADLTTDCPNNCISDNDGDEYGLGCDNGPDCKGDDSSLQTNCPNGCIDDNDGDGYGLGCPAGFDCDGENRREMGACENECIQDTDGDGFGIGCADGLDCNGRHPDFTQDCTNGCIFDEDGDGRGFGCDLGNDCNGINPFRFEGCANNCISDNEGDAAGWGCDGGADCNDTDPFVEECLSLTGCVDDHDGDGYGTGCELGADCDDYDFSVALDCTGNCTFDEDCNGLPDGWQEGYFNNTVCDDPAFCDAGADPDEDGFSNIEEFRRGTNPLLKEEVALPPEMPAAVTDTDGDGMSDECERLYDLDYENPDDAARDYDNDGLLNQEECNYRRGMCRNSGLSPISPDHDGDGYADPDEIDAGTDPCDPESRPSRSWIGILLVILGILCILGSTGYLVYKKYYVPLVSPPPKPTAVQSARPLARPPGARLPGVRHHLPRGLPPRPRGPVFSRTQFEDEMRKRADARESVLKAFGEKKARPRKVMEAIARRPGAAGRAGARPGRAAGMPGISVRKVEPAPAAKPGAKPSGKDYVSQLTKVVGKDSFERIAALSKQEADYMGRLATIAKRKEVPLEHDHVSKLAAITKKVAGDRPKKEELEKAFRKSDTDELDAFLSSRKHVETFIKEAEPGKAEPGKEEKTGHKPAAKGASKAGGDDFDKLAGIAGKAKGGFDALEDLSKAKRKDVISSLQEMSSKRAQKTAMSKIGTLSDAGSKEEIFREFEKMGREAHVDKNVFEVLLSYLMKSGKITKHDVGEILLELEKSGVLSKKDVSDVFFNLGMKDMPL